MTKDNIIRKEASDFFDNDFEEGISYNQGVHPLLDNLKINLSKYYYNEYKAIYLDQLLQLSKTNLQKHRDTKHNGLPDEKCYYDSHFEKIIFFIEQEVSILPVIAHNKNVENPIFKRTKIFISYSHQDSEWVESMKRHFVPFQDKIIIWDDTKIKTGQLWMQEISKAINEAKVAILFISADFFASKFIIEKEIPPLLKAADNDGATIMPIIVKPCLFDEFPNLNQYQAMNDPKKSLLVMKEFEIEELWTNVVRQTKRILEQSHTDEQV